MRAGDTLADLENVVDGMQRATTEDERRLFMRAAVVAMRNVTKRMETVLAALTEATKGSDH